MTLAPRALALAPAVALLMLAAPAAAVSIPNEVAWAEGTNWSHRANFLGFPEVWVYVPDSFSERAPERRGLVFHLTGCGQVPFQAAQAAGWPEAAEAYGMVVVVPGPVSPVRPNRDSPNVECFNYGYDGAFGVYVPRRGDPDQAAVIAAARFLTTEPAFADMAVDPNQVYVAGLSAGGAMAVEVACMAPDVFAGVATASAPGIATAQGTAVMPPPFGYGPATVANQCRAWADGSGAPDARAQLASQVVAIVSDDNGLPAGVGPFDTSKFNNQQIWDGDKFCPHVYQENRALAYEELLGVERIDAGAVVGRGTGIGCPGGERSEGDAGEVSCVIADFVEREWIARADVWADAEGNTRLVRIEQDTLRHAWPSGPIGFADHPEGATPTRATLRDEGYIVEATGEFDRGRTGLAPNGQYGVVYFNHDAIDFPMFVAGLWSHNNPRLPRHPDPLVDDLAAVVGADAGGAPQIEVAGRAVAAVGSSVVELRIVLTDAAGSVIGSTEPALNGAADVAFEAGFPGVADGRYRVTVTAVDETGAEGRGSVAVTVGEVAGEPPTVALDSVASGGPGCLTVRGTAADADGAVGSVTVTVLGEGAAVAEEFDAATGAWQTTRCGLDPGTYGLFAVALDDDGDLSLPTAISRVALRGGGLETASGDLTAHSNAGRVVRFSPEYFDYRERYCELVFYVWQCEPFDLYRCSADAPWTDAEPACGGAAGQVALALEGAAPAQVPAGDAVAFDLTVRNDGPDRASAVYVIDPLPAGLRFAEADGRCALTGSTVICHLGDLAAGAEARVEIVATAVGGQVANVIRAGSAQSDEVEAVVDVQVQGGDDPGDGVDPWSGIDDGEIDPVEPEEPEGVFIGCGAAPGAPTLPPVALIALVGGLLLVRRRRRAARV